MLKVKPKRGTHQIADPARLDQPKPTKTPNDKSAKVIDMPKRLLTVKEAAAYLGLCESTLRNLVWDGKMKSVRVFRRMLFDLLDLDKFIEASKVSRWETKRSRLLSDTTGCGMMHHND